jgi:uncharacterized membrane protein YgcG
MDIFETLAFVVIAGIVVGPFLMKKRSAAKSEALFQSMFPDLQPHFHPSKLVDYVRARRHGAAPDDESAAAIAQATYEEQPQGAVLRYGKGKFTVDVNEPRVKYWHPDREFKWQPKRKEPWWFSTPIAERSVDSSDSGTSWSSSDTARTAATGAAAAVPFAAAGGAFDGGGASQTWEGGDGGGGGKTAY